MRIEQLETNSIIDYLLINPGQRNILYLEDLTNLLQLADELYLSGIKVRILEQFVKPEERSEILKLYENGEIEVILTSKNWLAQTFSHLQLMNQFYSN